MAKRIIDWPCPVCGEKAVEQDGDYEGHETDDICTNCELYKDGSSYGRFDEQFGFVVQEWSYTEPRLEGLDRERIRKLLIEEARILWAHPDIKPFLAAIKAAGWEDDAPRLVFADWLQEHGLCPWNEEHLRMCQKEAENG